MGREAHALEVSTLVSNPSRVTPRGMEMPHSIVLFQLL